MKILSKLLVASFVFCVLSLSSFAQSEKDAIVKKNLECEDKGDWNCMLETAEKLIKLDPTDSAYLASRGRAYFELNKFDEAESDFFKVIFIAGKKVPLLEYFYGRLSIAKGDRKQATSSFNAAASNPNDPNHKLYQTGAALLG